MATDACARCGRGTTGMQGACPHCATPPPLPPAVPDFGKLVFSQPYRAPGARSAGQTGWLRWGLPVGIAAVVGMLAIFAVAGFIRIGAEIGKENQANKAALEEIEQAFDARKASVEGQRVASTSGPVRSADEGTLLQRAAVIMIKFQRQASAADIAYMDALARLELQQVLTPERLTSRNGLERNRVILDQARTNLDNYELAARARLSAFEGEIMELHGQRGFDDFVRGFNAQRQKTLQRTTRALSNQRELFAAALAVTEFAAERVDSLEAEGNALLFQTDEEAAQYNRLIDRVNALAAEEERIKAETLAALEEHADATRALRERY